MIWAVALGSAFGGVARYLLGGLVQQASRGSFPVGTLVINVSGSFLLGLFYRYAADSAAITPEVRAFLTIGFCGGYTTFSTFSYETVRLIEDGEGGRALLYAGLSLLLSIGGMLLGLAAGRELLVLRRS
ncbi:MAG: fluoride efflux transporter CrcB [Gemmatimonadota bacterium]|nr:fluoride efflux transporter CrcB [Gemmatimonadota bacterium]MDH5283850.1 fluoride efflux transporter CrcB [Gemmatimonadota bacterium]